MGVLPDELLSIVCSYLPLKGLKAVSLCSHTALLAAAPFLFEHLGTTWENLPELTQQPVVAKNTRTLRILSQRAVGEWEGGPNLAAFACAAPMLSELSVTCVSASTAWLAYLSPPVSSPLRTIKVLKLYPSSTSKQAYIFDFDHIYGSFPNLEELELEYAQIQCPALPLKKLRKLSMVNCTWWYPSTISDISLCLDTLLVKINNKTRAFAYSERLQHDMSLPARTLRSLSVLIDIGQTVPWKPLQGYVPETLEQVHLRGFEPFARAIRHALPVNCILHEEPPRTS